MPGFGALAAVSRSLRRLLVDRMDTLASITLLPPDVAPASATGPRVNLYCYEVLESTALRNDPMPGRDHPATYGMPPLSLMLRYLMTTHAATENQADSDLNAQALLGDAMLVLHDFGGRLDRLQLVTSRIGAIGEAVLDPALAGTFERVKVTRHMEGMEAVTRLWSALPQANFRRSVLYEASLVQLEPRRPRRAAAPVETRRILLAVARPPLLEAAFRTPGPPPADHPQDTRIAVGESVTLLHGPVSAERLYVRFGRLDPIRIALPSDGRIILALPDDELPADPDHPVPRPIPAEARLQPGAVEVRLLAAVRLAGVEGGLDRGQPVEEVRLLPSNVALLQLGPSVSAVSPASGTAAAVLRVTGTRLHAPDAPGQVVVGDAVFPVRAPGAGDAWAAPTDTQIELPVADIAAVLPPRPAPYPVAILVNGVRSRETGFTFRLDP
ncbi:MAG: DUF4255 domain-containing protein [Sphingomonadaceae bacterium]